MIQIKRVYDPPSPRDGLRVLVERLWPRGLTKQRARVGVWLKTIAPSSQLREWFNHDRARWKAFQKRYLAELKRHPDEVTLLKTKAKTRTVTLVFAARDVEHNSAVVLESLLTS